jgi:hypothetical protein
MTAVESNRELFSIEESEAFYGTPKTVVSIKDRRVKNVKMTVNLIFAESYAATD